MSQKSTFTKYQQAHITFVLSVLNKRIKILQRGWILISQFKHKEEFDYLKITFDDLIKSISDADVVIRSKKDKQIFLYYKKINSKYLCAVCRHYNGFGFLITCYPEDRPKGVNKIWPKKQSRKKIILK